MKFEVLDLKGKKVEDIELKDSVWAMRYNADLVAQCIYVYRSNQRSATAHAKTKGEVSGGGRKPWRQKGTGRARAGSSRSPLWVGGGVTFVPSNRNWSKRLNRGMKAKALSIMLSSRLSDGALSFISGVDGLERSAFEKDSSVVLVVDNAKAVLKFRNVQGVSVVSPLDLNVMDVVGSRKLIVDKEAVAKLEERLGNE